MNRSEFCELLNQAKKQSGTTTSDLMFDMRMQWCVLKRFETGVHNFNLKKVLTYLDVINAKLCLYNQETQIVVSSYLQIIQWFIQNRTGRYTQRELARIIGCTGVNLSSIEAQKSTMSIDTFLKLADVFGYTVTIKQNDK